jgi:hypothetical protein
LSFSIPHDFTVVGAVVPLVVVPTDVVPLVVVPTVVVPAVVVAFVVPPPPPPPPPPPVTVVVAAVVAVLVVVITSPVTTELPVIPAVALVPKVPVTSTEETRLNNKGIKIIKNNVKIILFI